MPNRPALHLEASDRCLFKNKGEAIKDEAECKARAAARTATGMDTAVGVAGTGATTVAGGASVSQHSLSYSVPP